MATKVANKTGIIVAPSNVIDIEDKRSDTKSWKKVDGQINKESAETRAKKLYDMRKGLYPVADKFVEILSNVFKRESTAREAFSSLNEDSVFDPKMSALIVYAQVLDKLLPNDPRKAITPEFLAINQAIERMGLIDKLESAHYRNAEMKAEAQNPRAQEDVFSKLIDCINTTPVVPPPGRKPAKEEPLPNVDLSDKPKYRKVRVGVGGRFGHTL